MCLSLVEAHRELDLPQHCAAEVAFYMPLTKAWGSNTIHVESDPGMGDFHPLVAEYGDLVRCALSQVYLEVEKCRSASCACK